MRNTQVVVRTMSTWRAGSKLLAFGSDVKAAVRAAHGIPSPKGAVSGVARRHASPQPVPCQADEASSPLQSAQEARPVASTSGREHLKDSKAIQEMFIYTMYKIRAKDFGTQRSRSGKKSAEQMVKDTQAMLLPLRLLADSKELGNHWADMYIREANLEMEAVKRMGERVDEQLKGMVKRGSGSELPAASGMIIKWLKPLTDAIAAEQRAILNSEPGKDRMAYGPHLLLLPAPVLANITLHGLLACFLHGEQLGHVKVTRPAMEIGKNVQLQVEMDLLKAKAQRISQQRRVLARNLMKGEEQLQGGGGEWSATWAEQWRAKLQQLPEFQNTDEEEIREELLKRLKELKAHEIPDPAESNPQLPLGSGAIIETRQVKDLRVGTAPRLATAVQRNESALSAKQLDRLNTFMNRARKASKGWEQEQLGKIGVRLIHLALESCYLDPHELPGNPQGNTHPVPALSHEILQKEDRKQGMIKLHDVATRRLNSATDVKQIILPAYQPMVIPPLPWRGVDYGAYLINPSHVMRTRGHRAQNRALYEADRQTPGMSQVYEALNALGEVGWRINREMLDVISHAWSREMDICSFPQYQEQPVTPAPQRMRFRVVAGGYLEPIKHSKEADSANQGFLQALGPAPPSAASEQETGQLESGSLDYDGDTLSRARYQRKNIFRRTQLLVTATRKETTSERRARRLANNLIRKFNREQYSMRCDIKYKLDVAEAFKDDEAIYFPHNLDFRGRAYPMHPHLQHLGNDLCRGLLEFAQGKPLGQEGLGWLFVQIANTWGNGVDKRSFEGRQQWVMDNLANVLESARQPIVHTWWQGSEAPWQMLAACKDVERALASGDQTSYVSHSPVMMDGSCNGLQHYAALGRDLPGGRAVNLTAVDKPQDVYSEVAELVRKQVAADAARGVEVSQLLLPEIDRKLVKQTVMTSVYGVTFIGARTQIANRLKERGFTEKTSGDTYEIAYYAAQQTMQGLHQRFGQAKEVMKWLTESARAISATGQPVTWTTPLGLPVVQPYRKKVRMHVSTTLQRLVLISDKKQDEPILKGRQRSAFPPNFIHSIDSSHMMMTAIACKQAGLAFAGVHDSFWTHAATMPTLNQLLREKFVELYRKPILQDLERQFKEQYPLAKLPPLPEQGDLDIEEVNRAPYFFS